MIPDQVRGERDAFVVVPGALMTGENDERMTRKDAVD
jgi:hypothetical protein